MNSDSARKPFQVGASKNEAPPWPAEATSEPAPPIRPLQPTSKLIERIRDVHSQIKLHLGLTQASCARNAESAFKDGTEALGLMLFEDSPAKAIAVDTDLNIQYANDAFVRVFGGSRLLSSRTLLQFVLSEDVDRVRECTKAAAQHPGSIRTLEFRVRTADKVRLMSSRWKYSPGAGKILIHLYDITNEREEKSELIALLRRSDPQTKRVALASWKWDLTARTLQCSREYVQLYGLDPSTTSIDGATWGAMRHPDDRDRIDREINDAIANTGHLCLEFRTIRPDGSTVWLAASGHVEYDPEGTPVSISGHTIDITDQKMAESRAQQLASALSVTTGALNIALEYLPMGALLLDGATGDVVTSNSYIHRTFGGRAIAEAYRTWIIG